MTGAAHGLSVRGVGKRFGPVTAVAGVDLDLPAGKLVSFLGPSGCGKTTLLRLVAGLETPSEGRILIDGEDVTDVPTHRRGIGMVFQSLALFPHLTVGENIGYGLAIRGVDRAGRSARAEALLDLVRLPGLAERHVAQLSGGQRQRVAIARALALEPKVFLLDEPLSSLDAKLREDMQVELRLLQQRLAITTIIVTHDQREAMTMSDLVVVMGHGTVQQVGPPLDIYRAPVNAFVAGFIGSTNLIEGRVLDAGHVTVLGQRVAVGAVPDGAASGGAIVLSIRPEDVVLHAGRQDGPNRVDGRVIFVRDVGASVETYVDCGAATVIAVCAPKDRVEVRPEDRISVEFPRDSCVVLPP